MPWIHNAPNPGSDKALKKGCTCDVLNNHYGRGPERTIDHAWGWWITEGCPIHAVKEGKKP